MFVMLPRCFELFLSTHNRTSIINLSSALCRCLVINLVLAVLVLSVRRHLTDQSMSSIDDLIRERLQKLRADDSPNSNLPSSSTQGDHLPKANKATAAEQVEDLLAHLAAESHLEAKVKKSEGDIDTVIRSRLEKLKSREGCNFSQQNIPLVSSENKSNDIHDEDFFNNSSCSELLDLHSDQSCGETSDSEELDHFCVICDKKPTLVCLGCDKDFYCNSCHKEFHSSGEKHRTVPYTNKTS